MTTTENRQQPRGELIDLEHIWIYQQMAEPAQQAVFRYSQGIDIDGTEITQFNHAMFAVAFVRAKIAEFNPNLSKLAEPQIIRPLNYNMARLLAVRSGVVSAEEAATLPDSAFMKGAERLNTINLEP